MGGGGWLSGFLQPGGGTVLTMSISISASRARWLVPGAAIALVVAGFAAKPLFAQAGSDGLPTVTADQLLDEVLQAEPQPLSGTVVYTADLGLPDVSSLQAAMGSSITTADPLNLLAGTSTLRVWTDAADRSRVALQGTASEFSVVRDGAETWTYSSRTAEAVHYQVSQADQVRAQQWVQQMQQGQSPAADLPTPTVMTTDLLTQVKEYSTVSLDAQTAVAGRSAYQLVVIPDTTQTLVSRVVVAVDAQTRIPLRLQVWSRQGADTPALEVGFTDVDFATPTDQVLTWSTPAGASVREVEVPLPSDADVADTQAPTVETSGTGWQTVTTITGVPVTALLAGDPTAAVDGAPAGLMPEQAEEYAQMAQAQDPWDADPQMILDQLTTPVAGGRLLSSNLGSILICDDGRVLLGAVPGDTLTNLAR